MSTKKIALCGLFICFAAALSAAETMLPPIVPIPGVRVGLGNIVTLFVLYIGGGWRAADALTISILRCFLAALITGSLMSAAYGIMGGLLSLGAMLVMRRLLPRENREKYLPFTGVAGAVFHIIGQLLTAVIFYGTFSVLAYLPILLSSAIIGGAFTGLCTMLLLRK
ncbi:MAG: Gx transporter family protein, partial [Oscillospiraceae bacterium]|nr:Gx transporter family protein [Oscillospiraceae bacterium]